MVRQKVFRALPVVLVVAVVGFYAATRKPRGTPPKMNVLLITIDTTRADHLGCYGYSKPTSPNLDQLAAESVQFDLAIAQAAVTPVSHASILTGLDPYRHGLRVLHGLTANRLADEQVTLAELWQEAGGGRGGVRVPSLVRTIDLLPTILEVAEVDPALRPAMDGETLTETMRTGRTAEPRLAYSDSVNMLTAGRTSRPDMTRRMTSFTAS